VLTDAGDDFTEGMVRAARRMLDLARAHDVRLALLMDISAACGSQVIYDGPRHLAVYRAGPGVAAALLIRNGVAIVSQQDLWAIGLLMKRLGCVDQTPANARDHHESD
jgi:uncharacterized protein YbbK (DUF523 family)